VTNATVAARSRSCVSCSTVTTLSMPPALQLRRYRPGVLARICLSSAEFGAEAGEKRLLGDNAFKPLDWPLPQSLSAVTADNE
jgi:hypothetical protein